MVTPLANPTTFLLDESGNVVRIIYLSYCSRARNMVADVDLCGQTVILQNTAESHATIAAFIGHNYECLGYRKMRTEGCDLGIILEYFKLLLRIKSADYQYVYFDARIINDVNDIVRNVMQLNTKAFCYITKNHSDNRCYCGITNDLDCQMEELKKKDVMISDNNVCAILCANKDIAVSVEKLLIEKFCIKPTHTIENCNNVTEQDASLVYLLKP